LNPIAKQKNVEGQKVSSFEDISKERKDYFTSLFKESLRCPIMEILKVFKLIPRSFTEEMNESLQAEISEGEVLATLESFHKNKILGLDETKENFLGLYDLLKEDLLKVVQESQQSRNLLALLSTFCG
jgi:hypothetical protein